MNCGSLHGPFDSGVILKNQGSHSPLKFRYSWKSCPSPGPCSLNSLKLCSCRGVRTGCSQQKTAWFKISNYGSVSIQRKYTKAALWNFNPKEFEGWYYDSKLQNQNKFSRYIVVRSELANTGTPDAAEYPLLDVQVGSKVRGICFYMVTAIVAIFLFVLMMVAHPFVLLFDPYRRKAHHFIAKVWATLTVTPFFKVEFEGLENLPSHNTPAVYVSNHQSFLDIYTLLTLGRSFKFISKTGIFVFPIIGWAMFMMGVIPLKRMDSRSQLDCFKRCMDLIKKGASVFFFPEGTRSRDGKLGSFKKGAFSVAAKTGVPVIPITLMGTGNIMPVGKEGILNSGSVKVVIHKPIEGKDPELLCNGSRTIIEKSLNCQG